MLAAALTTAGCAVEKVVVLTFEGMPQTIRVGATHSTIKITPANPIVDVRVRLVGAARLNDAVPAEFTVTQVSTREYLIEGFRPLRSGNVRFQVHYGPADRGGVDAVEGEPVFSEPFTVLAWQTSGVDCYADGTIIAYAATQTPAPTIELAGPCVLTTSGGDPVGVSLGSARCASATGAGMCTDGPGSTNCFSVGSALGEPDAAVDVTWTGDAVPAGAAALAIPETLTFGELPTTLTRDQPLIIPFSGGSADATVTLTALVPYRGSVMSIECTASAADGQLTVPARVTREFTAGMANLGLSYFTGSAVFAGDFRVDARVNGAVVGRPDLITVTVP